MDYFIKATDEAAFWEILIGAGVVSEVTPPTFDGEEPQSFKQAAEGIALDVIGPIFAPTGQTIEVQGPSVEMVTVPEMVAIEGFHANLRGTLTTEQEEALASVLIEKPSSPARVWA